MCGIAGILNLRDEPADPRDVRAITRALAHRGPDGEAVHIDGSVGLGHRRLAILDLTDLGAQPMSCVDGRYYVTFNGEIFNFVELRRELETHGHRFRTESDTEVIGHAYHRWGADCVLRFNGMWAFALWDTQRREVFLSRDHFGIKPLFYMLDGRRFVFASELKAFLHLRDFTPRESEDAMRLALFKIGDAEMVDETLLCGVKRLQAGFNMSVSAHSGSRVWRWWRTLDHIPTVPQSFGAQVEEFRELFFDACRLRLRSDVPVGSCLSGGVDSSAIVCTLAELRKNRGTSSRDERLTVDSQRAFVATFPGTAKDEREHAALAIRHAGAEARYRPMKMSFQDLPDFAYSFENVGGSLMLPLWLIYRELRRDGVTVSFDGHGGDELIGGYAHYVADSIESTSLLRDPLRKLNLMRTLLGMYGGGRSGYKSVARLALRQGPIGIGYRWARDRVSPQSEPELDLVEWARRHVPEESNPEIAQEQRLALDSLSPLNATLYSAVHHNHLPHILRNFERCSMAHGVEVRMPFLDWRLVCYCFGLPENSKIGRGYGKRILREAMRGTMPEPLRTRKDKVGFSPPMLAWFNGGLGDWLLQQVRRPSFVESSIWDGPAIRDFVERKQRTHTWRGSDCVRVWRFAQAHLWREIFIERAEQAAPHVATANALVESR